MSSTERTQYLTFKVADEQYAVEILRVREIIEAPPITQVPATPEAIRGVVNLRGSVVPVIDPGVRFGEGPRPMTRWNCIVFVDVNPDGSPITLGLLVDAIGQVAEIDAGAIEPVPPFGADIPLEFLRGLATFGRKFLHLLDIDRVLSTSELVAARSLAPAASSEPATPAATEGVR